MADQRYLKAVCQHCGENIEFPAEGLGMSVPCPHCQARTILRLPGAPAPAPRPPATSAPPAAPPPASAAMAAAAPRRPIPAPPPSLPAVPPEPETSLLEAKPKSKFGLLVVLGVGLVTLAAVGFVAYKKFVEKPPAESSSSISRPAKNQKDGGTAASANSQTNGSDATANSTSRKAPKSPQDLKSGEVTLEKSKGGSSLVYAVSTIRNESDYQRFGVKVEVDVFDGSAKRIGKATDYTQVIEPRNSWTFRALVLEPKAAAAKIASIKEDE